MSDPFAPTPVKISDDQRRAILLQAINFYVPLGYRVINQTDTSAQLVRPKRFSFLIGAFTFLCTFTVLFWLYLLLFLSMKDSVMFIAVDDYGQVSYNGRTPTRPRKVTPISVQLAENWQALANTTMGQRTAELWNSGGGGKASVLIGFGVITLIPLMICGITWLAMNTPRP